MIRLWKLVAAPVLLGFALLGGYLYFYLGGYKDVVVSAVDEPARPTVYRVHRGAYHKINDVIIEVENWAKQAQVSCVRTFGEYLDDPMKTEEGRLRSNGGCILEQSLTEIKPPENFQIGEIKAGRYVRAEFEGSPAIGPWKVYPRLFEFVETNALKAGTSTIEIYTIDALGKMRTEYLLPLLN